jgi:ribonucleoside-diphosphate reductase alpha chain
MRKEYGPTLPISKEIHEMKYRGEGETFVDCVNRQSSTLADNDEHRKGYTDILLNMRYMPAGRVQSAIGSPKVVTPWNCFVSGEIKDDFDDIMIKAHEAGKTMRLGGGIGYDFSTLRPRGGLIKSLDSQSSGPISFMDIFNSVCGTISSSGHRRGAQMAVIRVDHPDIIEFIHAKRNSTQLTKFNISVGVTDEFMEALKKGENFDLRFNGQVYDTVNAQYLWNEIMRSTWDWAEPGVLFIDRINEENNLWYCETIKTTNPCGEQPLPPYGACLLGSFNLTKYVNRGENGFTFDFEHLAKDVPYVVRAMDNIIDEGVYPLPQQEKEGKDKRRMGLGITGTANAIEACGFPYASDGYIDFQNKILETIRDESYRASIELAKEKGPFPLFDAEKYCQSKFIRRLPQDIQDDIYKYGIRNSHLTSVAPTGTISLSADNISSGIEPVFTYSFERTIQTFDGPVFEEVSDFGYREWGIEGVKAMDIDVEDHVKVLNATQKFVDSACSKTCNVGDEVSWERFKDVYMKAYEGGAKGCTTFRAAGKRYGILNEKKEQEEKETEEGEFIDDEDSVEACTFDAQTGQPTCS